MVVKKYKYSCDKCKFFTDNKFNYTTHQQTSKHLMNYNICKDCLNEFEYPYLLKKHLNRKTPCSSPSVAVISDLSSELSVAVISDLSSELSVAVVRDLSPELCGPNGPSIMIKDLPLVKCATRKSKYYYLRTDNNYNVEDGTLQCFTCVTRIQLTSNDCHRSHDIPKSRGGGWEKENIYLCCNKCNNAMSNKFGVNEYKILRQTL